MSGSIFNFSIIYNNINIDEHQIKILLNYMKRNISFKHMYGITLFCVVIDIWIYILLFINFFVIFTSPNCVYIFIIKNINILIGFFL